MVCEPETLPIASQTRRKRLTDQDIEAMAELNAKRLNDVEACELLDINYETWRSWKTRAKNQPRFARILARIKGTKIKNCMDSIEAAGKRDWRATREYLSLTDPDRFNDRAQQAPIVSNDGLAQLAQLGIDAAKLLMEGATRAKSRAVVEVQTKALTEGKE